MRTFWYQVLNIYLQLLFTTVLILYKDANGFCAAAAAAAAAAAVFREASTGLGCLITLAALYVAMNLYLVVATLVALVFII